MVTAVKHIFLRNNKEDNNMKKITQITKSTENFFVKNKKIFCRISIYALAVVLILVSDSIKRKVTADKLVLQKNIIGSFKNSSGTDDTTTENIPQQTTDIPDSPPPENTDVKISGFNDISLVDSENIGKGSLAVINSQYAPENFYTGLYSVESDNEIYFQNSPSLISENVLPHLKDMINDYKYNTQKDNIIIYNTTDEYNEDSLYSENYPEAVSGYSFDIAINSSYDETIEYDGMDTEGWISENCQNYGFVTRYPQDKEDITGVEYSPYHFRYVGIPHAVIMKEKNLCLEEYTEYIKEFTFDNPLEYTLNDTQYFIYYSKATVPSTTVYVPENCESYDISGNNYDGYIISYCSGTSSATEIPEEN